MSTDERLARLGLAHLKDQPEELRRALEERARQHAAEVEEWHASRANAETHSAVRRPWLEEGLAWGDEATVMDADSVIARAATELNQFLRMSSGAPMSASKRNRLRRHVDALSALMPEEGVSKGYAAHTLSLAERLLEEP